jgi:hypothetical protein
MMAATAQRVVGPTDKRDVTFHLTPYAPGCETAAINDRQRGLTVSNRRPGQALFALLDRLGLTADLVELAEMDNGEIAVHAPRKPHHVYAFVWSGLSMGEAASAHDGLKQHQRLRGAR